MKETRVFPADYDQLRPLCQFVLAGAERAGIDEKGRFQIELACDEAATNVIEHAYGAEGTGEIVATWETTGKAFRITLADTGQSFRPSHVKAITPMSAETISVGGLGVHFMKQLMDDVVYHFDQTGNKVILVKNLPAEQQQPISHTQHDEGFDTVKLIGRLDQETIPALESQLQAILAENRYKIILDLAETTYTNSGGLRIIVAVWREARQHNGDLILTGLNEQLQEIFGMVGFDKILTIMDNNDEAQEQLLG